ncbi:hypothetical protein GALL_109120 [mine drainage metagenome]|uniref:Uncharacterized protein n=1 Tax=mine drainage metagenome TaxID=410659 RepID=A0A1J5SSL1_9ZZZZ
MHVLYLKSFLYFLKKAFHFSKERGFIIRGACLTNDSLKILFPQKKIINYQKSRVDTLNVKYIENSYFTSFLDVRYISNKLYNLYLDQIPNFWKSLKFKKIFIIDSYSELTDQLFINKYDKRKIFCANYNDVTISGFNKYESSGLIAENRIYEEYLLFFKRIRYINNDIKIIYIFFPLDYETRIKFINQNIYIVNAINKLKVEFDIHIINIPSELLNEPRIDDFPYHYNDKVYNYVANQIKEKVCGL